MSRGGSEARSIAPAGVGVERELRDRQDLAVHVRERQVHEPGVVREDAQPGRLGGQGGGGGERVVVGHADQREVATADLGYALAGNGHRGAADALDEDAHARSLLRGAPAAHPVSIPALPSPVCRKAR